MKILPSFYAFTAGLIDYAGIFPPASLPLDDAIVEYAQHQSEDEAWMLSRFILPASRLPELTSVHIQLLPLWRFSVLGRGGESGTAWLTGLKQDLASVAQFQQTYPQKVQVDLLETGLPLAVVHGDDGWQLPALLQEAKVQLAGLRPFYELPFVTDWEVLFPPTVEAVAEIGQLDQPAGIKLRTGGIKAELFPTIQQLATAIIVCRDAGIPLKATAGLHHPIRHFDETIGTKMHGFFNLFGAGILGQVHHLDAPTLVEILVEETPTAFTFSEAGFGWRDFWATTAQIEACRQNRFISYGSCSFIEPRQDLQALGLLKSKI